MRSELTSAENWLECEADVHIVTPPLESVLQVGAHEAGDDGQLQYQNMLGWVARISFWLLVSVLMVCPRSGYKHM